MWLPVSRDQLYSIYPKTVLAHECAGLTVSIEKSAACHGKAEYGLFAGQNSREGDAVGSQYEPLVCADLRKRSQVIKR